MSLFSRRIHESIAISSFVAGSFALQIAWMTNVLVYRSDVVADRLTVVSDIGPVSGLYLITICTFFIVFLIALVFSKGRDVSHWRERVYWFFLTSVILFLVMSMPVIYQIGVVVE